jgi:CubicO group peptidase (beta-lactamase class C family)
MKVSLMMKLCVLVLALSVGVTAQITEQQKTQVDGLFKAWDTKDTPGAAVGVVKDGRLIYSKGYGMADLEHDVPLSSESVFYMASVSKQFVTFAVLLLEEQGKLGLDDEIQKHLPDFPRYKDPLTIRHFIHHTSGVRDSLTLWSLTGKDIYDTVDKDAMYELIKRQKELNFKPGDQYLYSNACYFMLALVVEKVSGKSIKDFAEENMFGPLGMKNTHFHDDQYHIVKNRVFSYLPAKSGYRNQIMRFDLVGSGGLYSTVDDMLLWDQNFYNNKLGKGGQELITKMETDGLLNSGKSAGYAFGISNGKHKGLRTVSHGGALAGYRTYSIRYPDQNFSVFVLSNVANFNPGGKSRSIAEIFLKDEFKKTPSTPVATTSKKGPEKTKGVDLPVEDLKKFASAYFSRERGMDVKVVLKDGVLQFEKDRDPVIPMKPLSKNSFRLVYPGVDVVLSFENAGKMNAVISGGAPIGFVSYEPVNYSAADLKNFAGTYYSEEINSFYHIKMEKDGPVVYVGDKKVGGLKVVMKNVLRNSTIGFFEFDEGLDGFSLDAGRVKNLKFVRKGD